MTFTQKSSEAGNVLIRGGGVAALCCAHLLQRERFRFRVEPAVRRTVPAIMLSEAALGLIRDIFGQPRLFANLPRIERRYVLWGDGAEPVCLAHSAVAVSEELLLESLGASAGDGGGDMDQSAPSFTIHTNRPMPDGAFEQHFGSQVASIAQIELPSGTDRSACWIESTADGWLFLIPNATGSTWLISVGGDVGELLKQSRMIRPAVASIEPGFSRFPVNPRLLSPACGESWIACGTAAIAFDPICGDGTAHAVREATLASAVVRAIAAGGDATSLLAHYDTSLTAAMRRHLALCADFYESGGAGTWWRAESDMLRSGFEWCTSKLSQVGEPRYRLKDFELLPLS